MPTKNMKLLMLKVLVDDMAEIPTRLDVNMLIFNIAFADSSSNAKSSPLMKFSFIALLKRWLSLAICLLEDGLIIKGIDNAAALLINGIIDVKTVAAITTIVNISMIEVIIEIMF
jgi:hypothetical protein